MIRVDKKNYKNFYKLFDGMKGQVGVLGVLDRLCEGEIYSDCEVDPKFAIMLTKDGYKVVGDGENKLFQDSILDLYHSEKVAEFEHISFLENWISPLKRSLDNYISEPIERYFYTLNGIDSLNFDGALNSDYRYIRITPENISQIENYENSEEAISDFRWFWEPYTKNPKFNFGYVVCKDKKVVSRCFPCQWSSTQNICELDIKTFEEFRKKGFALLVALETIKECFKLGYDKISWSCDTSNPGSWKTAEKLGFKRGGIHYLAWLDKRDKKTGN